MEVRRKRPLKVWDSGRNVRKALVVSTYEDLLAKGKEKLSFPPGEIVRVVLESDGTQVEDENYFRTIPDNTVLLFLRHGERWYPAGVDVIRAAISSIPKIVCETIYSLELQDEAPSWKIMDNRGRITVVLHWDQRGGGGASTSGGVLSSGGAQMTHKVDGSKYMASKRAAEAVARPPLLIQTSADKLAAAGFPFGAGAGVGTRKETLINDVYPSTAAGKIGPQITVINHDEPTPSSSSYGAVQSAYGARLQRQGSSFESTTIHIHTPECANHVHHPARGGSPNENNECDFHCCALHEEGRKIQVHKAVATSPIQDTIGGVGGVGAVQVHVSPQHAHDFLLSGTGGVIRRSMSGAGHPKGAHVRFLDVEGGPIGGASAIVHGPISPRSKEESSESETENTMVEDEAGTTEKFLLLIDQLSVEQKNHLTIKDIGIILERLSSKIVDVERLDRESESAECHNWTIKATIRGDVLRELGVIYNGNYYAISEHPGYREESEDNKEEVEEEEEEDRL